MSVVDTGRRSRRRTLSPAAVDCLTIVLIAIVALMLLRLFPYIDITVSIWFFTQQPCLPDVGATIQCGKFMLEDHNGWQTVRLIVMRLPQIFAIGLFAWLCWLACFVRDKTVYELFVPTHGLLSLAIGPMLLVNTVAKEWFGRPRPYQTAEFGGSAPYVLPGDFSDTCLTNCSFVSGEAAAGFWFMWVIPFLPRKTWLPASGILLTIALLTGLLRIAFGRHFFSDIVVSGFISAFAIFFSYWLLTTPPLAKLLHLWCNFSNRNAFFQRWFDRWSKRTTRLPSSDRVPDMKKAAPVSRSGFRWWF